MRPVNQGGCVVAEDTVFSVLYDKFMFWAIIVGVFTFAWLYLAVLRYREGVEPDTTHIDHIEVGAFPVDRHNTRVEVFFYVLPTLIVVWLIMMALASNTAVWSIPDDEDAHNMTIIGKQWFWEYHYEDALTWEDDPASTGIDVDWTGDTVLVTATGTAAANFTVSIDGADLDPVAIDSTSGIGQDQNTNLTFNPRLFATVEVTDTDGALLHTWMHIPGMDPNGNMFSFSSALGEDMIIPCDEDIVFTMHSRPSDDSNPNYIGVQHSFWLPEWGVKEDLVPGIEGGTVMTVMADDAGTFPIRCAEYCGAQHSVMYGQVKVVAAEGTTCAVDTGVKKTPGNAPPAGGAY